MTATDPDSWERDFEAARQAHAEIGDGLLPDCMSMGCGTTPTVVLVVEPAPASGAERPYCDTHAVERRRLFGHRLVDDRPIR